MGSFAQYINGTYVPTDGAAVFWAGQAGFVIKTGSGRLAALDLYLSDCCERYFGFKRVMPYILEPHELDFDCIIASHSHYDHFDVDSIPMLMRGKSKFIGASDTRAECERLGIKKGASYIKCSESAVCGDISVKGVPCDHGELAPEALGLLIKTGDKTIYYAGDTAYREDYFSNDELKNADVLILPINGKFGNMNSREAADAAERLCPKLTIPCHFWNFAEHGGNPGEFVEIMNKKKLNYKLLRIGEGIII